MYEDKVKTREIFLPTCLTLTELLRVFKICEIFVISQDSERVGGTFKIVAPFLKGMDDSEKLTVVNVVVAFCVVERTRHEGDRVPITISILLTEDGTSREFGSVSFELKWTIVIGNNEDGGGGKQVFKLVKSVLVSRGPKPRDIFTCKGVQWCDDI